MTATQLNENFQALSAKLDAMEGKSWPLIHEKDFTTPTQTYSVTGLDGNTETIYQIVSRIRNQAGSSVDLYIRPNADAGTNYGFQLVTGLNTAAGAAQNTSFTGLLINNSTSPGALGWAIAVLYAKAGYERTMVATQGRNAGGTTVSAAEISSTVWNNSAANITSLDFFATQPNGIGAGSHIEIWARR